MKNLGKLEKVKDLRTVWGHEALDFTNWLAEEENLETLSNEIGFDIELLTTEAKTGSFSTDILAIESGTNNKVVIENQLESTNHDHLGKIITYASGHDAKTVIWIVKEAKEEHRQAIDWLNEHTDEDINIFLCKIELWRIGDSAIAPKFQILSQPNSWTKTFKRSVDENNMTSTRMLQYNYWTSLSEEINKNYIVFNSRKPNPQHWYDLAIGSSLSHIALTINIRKKEIKSAIWIPNNKGLFDYLYDFKDEIESENDLNLIWDRKNNSKGSEIAIFNNFNLSLEENWGEAIRWQLDMAEKLYDIFSDKIKKFN